jgi:hypothetical protein
MTALFPRQKAGIGFVASSDSGIERLSLEMIKGFVDLMKGDTAGSTRLENAAVAYPQNVSKVAARREAERRKALSDPQWGGWAWSPSEAELSALQGRYHEPAFRSLRIARDPHGLWMELGAYRARLQPAKPGLFAVWSNSSSIPETLSWELSCDCIRFKKRSFQRASAAH